MVKELVVPVTGLFLPLNQLVDFRISLLFDEILSRHNGTFPTGRMFNKIIFYTLQIARYSLHVFIQDLPNDAKDKYGSKRVDNVT